MLTLNPEEEKALNGGYGSTIQKAIDHLVKVGEALGARRMVKVSRAHILSMEVADILYELTYRMLEKVQVKIPTTTNPLAVDLNRAGEMNIPRDIIEAMQPGIHRLTQLHKNAGVLPTYSCHPHYLHELAVGQRVAFTEFNVAPLANSWFGARTNLGGQTDALASAVTGKAPECGLYLMENRWGEVVIEISGEVEPHKFDSSDYGALGYWAGQVCVDRIPIYVGLKKDISSRQVEYMGVGQVLAGSLGMLHIVGVTPESPTMEDALGRREPEEKFVFGKKELAKVYAELNTAKKTKVDMVCLGCPHCPIEEVIKIAQLLYGKRIEKNVRLWIGTSQPTYFLAKQMGLLDIIETAGGFVLCNVCAGTGLLLRFADRLGVQVVANNGLTLSGLVSRRTRGKVGVYFGNIEQCINAAITGYWEGKKHEI
jgi:predicted aconitase